MSKRQEKWLEIAQQPMLSPCGIPRGLCGHVNREFGIREHTRFSALGDGVLDYSYYGGYWWHWEDTESRILFACLMAAMTDKEYEELLSSAE